MGGYGNHYSMTEWRTTKVVSFRTSGVLLFVHFHAQKSHHFVTVTPHM